MKTIFHYCVKYTERLANILTVNNIRYEIVGDKKITGLMLVFDVEKGTEISRIVEGMTHWNPIITNKYSENEKMDAVFLTIVPTKHLEIDNNEEAFAYMCRSSLLFKSDKYNHEEQIKDIRIKKEPPISSKTAFFSSECNGHGMFCSSRIHDLACVNGLTGLCFRQVINRKGEVCTNVFQMMSEKKVFIESISKDNIKKIKHCPRCGKQKYIVETDYQLHLLSDMMKTYENDDFVQTEAVFGEGIPHSIELISQKFYRILKDRMLLKNTIVEPVLIV